MRGPPFHLHHRCHLRTGARGAVGCAPCAISPACCSRGSSPAPPRTRTPVSADATHAGAPLPFIDDDYSRRARRSEGEGTSALFVDVWAPWCHTCRSMKAERPVGQVLAARAAASSAAGEPADLTQNANVQEKFPSSSGPRCSSSTRARRSAAALRPSSATVVPAGEALRGRRARLQGGVTGAGRSWRAVTRCRRRGRGRGGADRKALAEAP